MCNPGSLVQMNTLSPFVFVYLCICEFVYFLSNLNFCVTQEVSCKRTLCWAKGVASKVQMGAHCAWWPNNTMQIHKYITQIYYTNILHKYIAQIYYTNILHKYITQIQNYSCNEKELQIITMWPLFVWIMNILSYSNHASEW